MDFERKLKYIYSLVLNPLRSIHVLSCSTSERNTVGSLFDKDICSNHSIFTFVSQIVHFTPDKPVGKCGGFNALQPQCRGNLFFCSMQGQLCAAIRKSCLRRQMPRCASFLPTLTHPRTSALPSPVARSPSLPSPFQHACAPVICQCNRIRLS